MNTHIKGIWTTAICSLLFTGNAAVALPPTNQGIAIGNLIVNAQTGAPYYVNTQGVFDYTGYDFGQPVLCFGDYFQLNGPSHNNYFWSDPLIGCGATSGVGGSVGADHLFSSTLEDTQSNGGGEYLVISIFERSSLAGPISLQFEDFVHLLGSGEALHVTPLVLDQDETVLYTGPTVVATSLGFGPEGGNEYSVTLDGIPQDVTNANVTRYLDLDVVMKDGDTERLPRIFSSLQLTRKNEAYCSELMQLGPASMAIPADIQETFGCPSIIPPGQCKADASTAIAAARNVQKTTRKVGSGCSGESAEACNVAKYNLSQAFEQLVQAKSDLEESCH